jgi:hypothetical protein
MVKCIDMYIQRRNFRYLSSSTTNFLDTLKVDPLVVPSLVFKKLSLEFDSMQNLNGSFMSHNLYSFLFSGYPFLLSNFIFVWRW